jgi:hypothetical protein
MPNALSHDREYLCLVRTACSEWTHTVSFARGMTRVLCVAEKPSIAKAVAGHLGGHARAVSLESCTDAPAVQHGRLIAPGKRPGHPMGQELQV